MHEAENLNLEVIRRFVEALCQRRHWSETSPSRFDQAYRLDRSPPEMS